MTRQHSSGSAPTRAPPARHDRFPGRHNKPPRRRMAQPGGRSMAETRVAAPNDMAVIVTGAARGLGRAMTLALAQAGVRVAAADLPSSRGATDELLALARQSSAHERIFPVECDV